MNSWKNKILRSVLRHKLDLALTSISFYSQMFSLRDSGCQSVQLQVLKTHSGRQALGLAGRLLLGTAQPTVKCLGLRSSSSSHISFLLMLGDNNWCLNLSSWHLHGRPRFNSQCLVSAWPSPSCCGHLGSELAAASSLCVSLLFR